MSLELSRIHGLAKIMTERRAKSPKLTHHPGNYWRLLVTGGGRNRAWEALSAWQSKAKTLQT